LVARSAQNVAHKRRYSCRHRNHYIFDIEILDRFWHCLSAKYPVRCFRQSPWLCP